MSRLRQNRLSGRKGVAAAKQCRRKKKPQGNSGFAAGFWKVRITGTAASCFVLLPCRRNRKHGAFSGRLWRTVKLLPCPAVCRNKRKRWRRAAPGQNKNSGRSIDLPLLAHTPAFSSRQTVTGKLMTFLSATEHAHGHHTHAHLAHHHGNGTLHVSFPP